MNKCGKVVISLIALAVLAAVFWGIVRSREPRYQGKPLSTWLRVLESGIEDQDEGRMIEARQAITAMGTNALPCLIKKLGTRDPVWKTALGDLLDKQSVVDWRPRMAELEQYAASQAFEILGETAAPAIPQLAALLPQPHAAPVAVMALANIGPPALPVLREALTNRNIYGRECIPFALGHIAGDKRPHLPVLLDSLRDPDPSVRSAAVQVLGILQMEEDTVVPALVPLIRDPDLLVRRQTARALGRFPRRPELVVPALAPGLDDPNWSVRHLSLVALAAFGPDAREALPALQRAADSSDENTRARARRIIHRLQCEVWNGGIIRGPKATRTLALVFTGHEFAEGGETILDALQRHQGRASFFLTGDFLNNENFDPLLRRMFNENHLLGPHSDKHLLYCSWEKERETLVTQEQFMTDVRNNREKIRSAADRLDERPDPEWPPLLPHELEAFRQRYGFRAATNHPPAPPQSAAPAGLSTNAAMIEPSGKPGAARDDLQPPIFRRMHSESEFHYFLPAYEHYNREIANWTAQLGMTLINFTPGTRSNADYTGEADRNFVSSQVIFDSILKKEREDPHGLNGFILLLHLGAGPGRTDKFHHRFGELLDVLAAKGYQFVRVDELLEPKETQ